MAIKKTDTREEIEIKSIKLAKLTYQNRYGNSPNFENTKKYKRILKATLDHNIKIWKKANKVAEKTKEANAQGVNAQGAKTKEAKAQGVNAQGAKTKEANAKGANAKGANKVAEKTPKDGAKEKLPKTAYLAMGLGASQLFQGYMAGQAEKTQAEYSKMTREHQARLADLGASDIMKMGETEASRLESETSSLLGAQKTAQAAKGLDIGVGSPADFRAQTEMTGAMDAQTIRDNAWKQAFGFKTQASNLNLQGRWDRETGRLRERESYIGGALNAAHTYFDYQRGMKSFVEERTVEDNSNQSRGTSSTTKKQNTKKRWSLIHK